MMLYLNEQGYQVHLPDEVKRILLSIERLSSLHVNRGGKPLDNKEIAEETGYPEWALTPSRSVFVFRRAALMTRYMGSLQGDFSPRTTDSPGNDYEFDVSHPMHPVVGDDPPSVEDIAVFHELQAKINVALSTLSEREAGIIRLYFGLNDGRQRTLKEISGVYGISANHVRTIFNKTIRKLKHLSRKDMLRDFYDHDFDGMSSWRSEET